MYALLDGIKNHFGTRQVFVILTCMNSAHVFTFWVDDEALYWASLQLAIYKVIQGLQKETLVRRTMRKSKVNTQNGKDRCLREANPSFASSHSCSEHTLQLPWDLQYR